MKFHIPLIDLWKNYLYNISIAKTGGTLWIIITTGKTVRGARQSKNRTNMLIFMIPAVIVLSSMYFMRSIYSDATEQEVPYSEFVELVKDGKGGQCRHEV